MDIFEQMKSVLYVKDTLDALITDIDDTIEYWENIPAEKRTDAQKAVLRYAQHLKYYYTDKNKM